MSEQTPSPIPETSGAMSNDLTADAATPHDGTRWYFAQDGTPIGPMALAAIQALWNAGELPQGVLVAQEGADVWLPLSEVLRADVKPSTRNKGADGRAAMSPPPLSGNAGSPASKPCPMCGEQILFSAKKCKHCGEYLDANSYTADKSKRRASDALGIVIMLLPLAATALMVSWISSMNLLQNPSSTLAGIVIVTIIATSALIAVEASQLGMGGKRGGKPSTGPVGWFLCGLGMWIIAFPAYLYWRSKFGMKNYMIGGLASALIFCGGAFILSSAIEQKKSEIRSHFDDANEKLRDLQRQFQN